MPTRYARYALETKLRVVEVARRGGVWEETAEHLGVNYHTVRAWDHRQAFLHTAANRYLPEVTTAANCRKHYRHTLRFHAMISDLENMPVGT
ncbi:hypothetical protein PC112_g10383 [Phytophthora cactorum]|nr:hypothetical protein PC112_g10383 [Phytophthora cactorum]